MAVFGEHDVGRLQIAVHDPRVVRASHALRDFNGKIERASGRQRTARRQVREFLAAHQLHGDEADAVGFVDFVDHRDVRMLERRRRLCFLDEAGAPIRIGDELRRQHLQRHVAVQPRIAGAIDHAHTSAADFVEDFVAAERAPDQRGHADILAGIRDWGFGICLHLANHAEREASGAEFAMSPFATRSRTRLTTESAVRSRNQFQSQSIQLQPTRR